MRCRPPPRLPHDHLADLVLVEPTAEQAVGPQREPVLDGRVVRVPAVAREERALDADRAHAVEDMLPLGLPAQRRAQAALQEAPALCESALIIEREVLTRELRVRDDDLRDSLLTRTVDDGERVVASEVARGENQVIACDRPQHVSRLGQEPSVGIGDVHRVHAQSEASKLVLESCPLGNLVPVLRLGLPAVSAGESTVGIQTIRAPSRAAISTARAFMPPTAQLRVRVPTTSTSENNAETTCARSAVDV